MGYGLLILLALGLSVDAFAISIGLGVVCRSQRWLPLKFATIVSVSHIIFALVGVVTFEIIGRYVGQWDEYVAMVFLLLLGGRMVVQGIRNRGGETLKESEVNLRNMILLGMATSIDAFVVGGAIGLTRLELGDIPNYMAVGMVLSIIAVVVFVVTYIGMRIGRGVGRLFGQYSEIAAGLILIGVAMCNYFV